MFLARDRLCRRLASVLLTLCLLTVTLPLQAALPPAVAQALQRAAIPPGALAVVTRPLDRNGGGWQHNATQPFNPASLMKLLTTFVALEQLGPAATWRTELLATAPLNNGVLAGDLILRGSGDPKLTYDRLWLLLRELRGRGLETIAGDLLLDRSAFALAPHNPAAFDAKPLRPYNVGADALLFNFATLTLTLIPETNSVRLLAEPLPAGLTLVNRLQLSDENNCGEWRERLTAQFVPGQIILSGNFPRSCEEKRWHLAGLPNAELLHGVFVRLWQELGGRFGSADGTGGKLREGITPATAILLASSESPPLGELVRDINKYSNNTMAQQVYLSLGRKVDTHETASAGATALAATAIADATLAEGAAYNQNAAAEKTLRDGLAAKGLSFPELLLENGSGLSRTQRISAASLARLLEAAWASAVMPEFLASLPIAASDGTIRKKYNGSSIAGQAHLKTGSLTGVRGIAGYLLDRHGRRHLVVALVNHANAAQAQPAFDALLDTIWRGEAVLR